eukprot:m.334792 g.334792  ORF g.334792 m.334792 type:complete len:703 (+) comp17440_c1_seq1:161-2269(+)
MLRSPHSNMDKAEKKRLAEEKKRQKEEEKNQKKLEKQRAKEAKKKARKSVSQGDKPTNQPTNETTPQTNTAQVKPEAAKQATPSPKKESPPPAQAPVPTPAREPTPEPAPAPEEPKAAEQPQTVAPAQVQSPPSPEPVKDTPKEEVPPPSPKASDGGDAPSDAPQEPVKVVVEESPTKTAEAKEEEEEAKDSFEENAKLKDTSGGIKRSNSARRSLHGAPQAAAAGVTVVEAVPKPPTPTEDEAENESNLGAEIVEDPWDEQVGAMNSEHSDKTAAYLAEVYNKLRSTMEELHAGGTNRGYSQKYQAMNAIGRNQPAEDSYKEANKLKNRYGNITAYDHSRVQLPVINEDPDTNYINANWINGYKRERAYIASQGPVPNSFISFWRMIWHQNIEVVAMVTHEIENNRMKCHRYWPDPTSMPPVKTLQYGSIYVTHISSVPHKHFIVREFEVKHGDETRKLKQFAYTSWPDHGVPLTTQELLGFRNAVRTCSPDKSKPLLVHCSAGVGRTGTYIAIDRLVEQALDMGGELNIDAIVTDMRMARNFMVQTEIQYMFIYRAVVDALSELLSGESKKASLLEQVKEAEEAAAQALARAAEEAARAEAEREKTLAQEKADIEAAKQELTARYDNTAQGARKVVVLSIKERMALLQSAEERWLESYRQSIEEWNERNKFEAETYDLTSTLTPIQSRIEALRQKGMFEA